MTAEKINLGSEKVNNSLRFAFMDKFKRRTDSKEHSPKKLEPLFNKENKVLIESLSNKLETASNETKVLIKDLSKKLETESKETRDLIETLSKKVDSLEATSKEKKAQDKVKKSSDGKKTSKEVTKPKEDGKNLDFRAAIMSSKSLDWDPVEMLDSFIDEHNAHHKEILRDFQELEKDTDYKIIDHRDVKDYYEDCEPFDLAVEKVRDLFLQKYPKVNPPSIEDIEQKISDLDDGVKTRFYSLAEELMFVPEIYLDDFKAVQHIFDFVQGNLSEGKIPFYKFCRTANCFVFKIQENGEETLSTRECLKLGCGDIHIFSKKNCICKPTTSENGKQKRDHFQENPFCNPKEKAGNMIKLTMCKRSNRDTDNVGNTLMFEENHDGGKLARYCTFAHHIRLPTSNPNSPPNSS